MRTLIISLLLLEFLCLSAQNPEKVKIINIYADSLDNVINKSSGYPGEIFCNTISAISNVRAIGLQETKINFYFNPKEDSVIDFGDSVQFITQYNPPLKIKSEYNIAASQSVTVDYYFDGAGTIIYYHFLSTGAYGRDESRMWFQKRKLIHLEYSNEDEGGKLIKKDEKFTKDEKDAAKDVLMNSDAYIEEYYNIFNAEQIDK